MSSVNPSSQSTSSTTMQKLCIKGSQATVLTDIYRPDSNIVVWQRSLEQDYAPAKQYLLQTKPKLQLSCTLSPGKAVTALTDMLGKSPASEALINDIAELVDMFCCLFDLKRAGLRLTALDRAMCPRFHVDRVPCRLVTTYWGEATQWLPHELVDRRKLGLGSEGKPDQESGLFSSTGDIQQLAPGDVALLKGELWPQNQGAGLVHRSPSLPEGGQRLLLTLDFVG